ncbi:MAG: hypothetical protein R2733_19275 [Acidimicrobiales bacterium]
MAPQPGYGAPPPGPQAPGTYTYGVAPKKSSKAGWWVLGILLFLMVVGVGGCLLIATVLADGAAELGDTFAEFEDEFDRRQEATQAIAVTSCSLEGGVPTASGTVTNPRTSTSSYFVQVEFFDTATGASLGTADVSVFAIPPGDTESWELSAPTSGVEGAIKCERGFDAIRIED